MKSRFLLLSLQKIIDNMFNIYKTYNKAKEVFVRPKLKVSFGLWKNIGILPVWRRGNMICIANHNQCYEPKDFIYYKKYNAGDIKEDGTVALYAKVVRSNHKLPEGCNGYVWNRNIRKKLKKIGLGWLKPKYFLPIWLSFYKFDLDVIYKWKYDTIRFEYPPQFTLVFFGLALSFVLVPELEDENDSPDHYWESLLSYLYQPECNKNVSDTVKFCGQWERYRENKKIKFFQLRKTHIKSKYHDEYDKGVEEYNNKRNKK